MTRPDTPKCAGDHRRPTPAVTTVSFPTGRFNTERACVGHTDFLIRLALDEGLPVLVTPLGGQS